MAFIKLTKQTNGDEIYLSTRYIVAIYRDETVIGSMVLCDRDCNFVKETPEEIMKLIESAESFNYCVPSLGTITNGEISGVLKSDYQKGREAMQEFVERRCKELGIDYTVIFTSNGL